MSFGLKAITLSFESATLVGFVSLPGLVVEAWDLSTKSLPALNWKKIGR